MTATINTVNEALARRGIAAQLIKGAGFFYFEGADIDPDAHRVKAKDVGALSVDEWLDYAREACALLAPAELSVREALLARYPDTAPEWLEVLDAEVLDDCNAGSAVGHESLVIIVKAEQLLANMLDLHDHERESIRLAVAHQCRVFYFG